MKFSRKVVDTYVATYDGFVLVTSILGGAVAILAIAVIALVVWNCKLNKKIKGRALPENFKIRRPRLISPSEQKPTRLQEEPYNNFSYEDPPIFKRSKETPDYFNMPSTSKGMNSRFEQPASPASGYPPQMNHFERNDRFY